MLSTDASLLAAGSSGSRGQETQRAGSDRRVGTRSSPAGGGGQGATATTQDTTSVARLGSQAPLCPISDAGAAAEQVQLARSEILQLVDMSVLKQSLEQQRLVLSLFESS